MPVKHTPPNSTKSIIHKGAKGGKTGCNEDTTINPSHWSNTSEKITCKKDGCNN